MRTKLFKFYSNLIDDVENEDTRASLLDRLEMIDDELFELDCDIESAIESQEEDEYITSEEQDIEFMYANRIC